MICGGDSFEGTSIHDKKTAASSFTNSTPPFIHDKKTAASSFTNSTPPFLTYATRYTDNTL